MNPDVSLRPWKHEDAGQLAAIANNKKIWLNVRDRFPHPYTVGDALEWIAYNQNQRPAENLAVIYQGTVAGGIGIIPKTDVYRKTIELGYFIGEPFWGKGIATRAVHLLLAHITAHYDVVRIFAEVFEQNTASMQVLKKNGFHCECTRQKAVFKNGLVTNDQVWVKLV